MYSKVSNFIRKELKAGLAQLPEENQVMFKRMYSHRYTYSKGEFHAANGSVADLEKPIDQVVDDMPDQMLEWALQQVDKTIEKELSKEGV